MAAEDSSFNSSGDAVVAFQTINSKGRPAFGVSADASQCGVYGEGVDVPHDPTAAPSLTGVLGRGDFHGVYGISSQISDDDTPDFGGSGVPGIGVIGVTAGDTPAILGNNGIVGEDFADSTAMTDLTLQQIGIAGVNRVGPGVFGLSLSDDLAHDPNIGLAIQGGEFGDRTNVRDAGVEGLSLRGPGVRGVSRYDRGGVFQSATPDNGIVAQLRLFPVTPNFMVPGADPEPPSDMGEAGDLLALTYIDGNQRTRASLWFCIEGVSTYGSTVWVRLI